MALKRHTSTLSNSVCFIKINELSRKLWPHKNDIPKLPKIYDTSSISHICKSVYAPTNNDISIEKPSPGAK